MYKDLLSRLLPLIATLILILIKLFLGFIVIVAALIFFLLPGSSGQTEIFGLSNPPIDELDSTLSSEDAALANSEWSGVFTQLTAVPEGTQISIPTVLPTVLPTGMPVDNPDAPPPNNSQAQSEIVNASLIGSPLEGFGVGDIKELISQEFKAPPPGEDSGHHGVDFAYWNRGNKPILGVPILAVFGGNVVMANPKEIPPYGYVLMVETPLSEVPGSLVQSIEIPTQPIGTSINNKLNCPDLSLDQWDSTSKSLYTLYGHLLDPPLVLPGEQIVMGQTLGYVGNSGYSSAPHLHLEMRIGPSGATFSNMGHYDPITTEEDRHNYCNFRISGVFQMFDPMDLFNASLLMQ